MPSSTAELVAFSRRLRSLRRAYANSIDLPDLSPAEFARMLSVPLASFTAYERGEQEPPLSVLAALHHKTGVSLDWLIADETNRPAAPGVGKKSEPATSGTGG